MELDELHGARVANEERFARQLLAQRERDLGFVGYADWLDAGCPPDTERNYPHEKIADICFYVASARTRPTADLGEDGELETKLRSLNDGWGAGLIVGEEKLGDLGTRAADRLILYREALVEAVALLVRYRKETPLGHQPHMIAHLADAAIERCNRVLSRT